MVLVVCACAATCFSVRPVVSNIVGSISTGGEDRQFGMLWLFAYLFLLRVPSEAGLCPAKFGMFAFFICLPCASFRL